MWSVCYTECDNKQTLSLVIDNGEIELGEMMWLISLIRTFYGIYLPKCNLNSHLF